MVEQHFSKEDTVEFSLFNQGFQNIMSHLAKSNQLLEDVKDRNKADRKSREQVLMRIQQIEKSAQQSSDKLENRVRQIKESVRNREQFMNFRDRNEMVENRFEVLENQLLQQEQIINEVNQMFKNVKGGIMEENQEFIKKEKKFRESQRNAEVQVIKPRVNELNQHS